MEGTHFVRNLLGDVARQDHNRNAFTCYNSWGMRRAKKLQFTLKLITQSAKSLILNPAHCNGIRNMGNYRKFKHLFGISLKGTEFAPKPEQLVRDVTKSFFLNNFPSNNICYIVIRCQVTFNRRGQMPKTDCSVLISVWFVVTVMGWNVYICSACVFTSLQARKRFLLDLHLLFFFHKK